MIHVLIIYIARFLLSSIIKTLPVQYLQRVEPECNLRVSWWNCE